MVVWNADDATPSTYTSKYSRLVRQCTLRNLGYSDTEDAPWAHCLIVYIRPWQRCVEGFFGNILFFG
jgi:hypothetical protein